MHPVLRYSVDQAQVECQVGIFQEEGHYHGVSSAYSPDTPLPNQEDQVKLLFHSTSSGVKQIAVPDS